MRVTTSKVEMIRTGNPPRLAKNIRDLNR